MKTRHEQLKEIHMSLVKGQRKQMVRQIDEYGLYDFWEDYKEYLSKVYESVSAQYDYFSDAAGSYHRVKELKKALKDI